MKEPIRVLHLEDSSRDAEIIQDRLESDGLACGIRRVDSEEGFAAALAEGPYDVILCDYNLSGYDGISALKLAREKLPLTPVLLISGSLGEEDAVKSLQQGATDYLLKERLDRLPSAVRRALQGADEFRRRRQAEEELRESEQRFRHLAEQSSDGFAFVELNPRRVLYVSPAVEKIWGRPAGDFYRDPGIWFAAIHEEDRARVQDALSALLQGRTNRFEVEFRIEQPDGTCRWVLESGTPLRDDDGAVTRVSSVVRDITERKQTECQMLRAQRLESIGTLASGVAHDLNNMLAPIMMSAELIRLEYPEKASRYLDMIEHSAQRGADLVKQLLTFAKGAEGEFLPLQPRYVLKDIESLITNSFPKNIDIRTHCDKDLHTIRGDATQLHQVLLNLCVNARDAMPDGGRLTIRATNAELDEKALRLVPEARPGSYVVWRIEDTGAGIAPEVLERIFEPFFTTKGPEKGTGLGLSTVIGIIKGHGGFVRVQSVLGEGTTFIVHLPAAAEGANKAPARAAIDTTFRGDHQTILVVDDDAGVREVFRAILGALHFKVLTAPDGTNALLRIAEHGAKLAAVITDCHMPNMDGLAFVRVLKGRLPQAGIIVASGRLDDTEREEFLSLGVNALLDKPFSQGKLVEALMTVFPHQPQQAA